MQQPNQHGEDGIESPDLTTSPLDQERINTPQTSTLTGLSKKTVKAWGLVGKHGFPQGTIMPDSGMMFSKADVLAWIAERDRLTQLKREGRDAQSA